MGNFNPILLRDGSPEQVAEAAEKMIRENLPGGRYIFNTGEGVMCNSPPANVAAMLDAAKAPLKLLVVITEGVPTLDALKDGIID